ncbi:unnamed protein product [Dovyalis caffra]|uniref:Uncharacterized protein n=1 Tax=Dovyalis caffra TaxID=77055 RepID=A0AAV1RSE4_9ROSI|nr:unnamed protein product [Dovyalis caffra]
MGQEEEAGYTHQLGSTLGSAQVPPSPSLVTLSPFPAIPTPSSRRRLSSHFTPNRAVPSARRLAWVSLQGRVVNAEEASSGKAIGLSREDGVAWELFSPAQRFLIVAVIGVAVSESKKNGIINQLQKSVELRVCCLILYERIAVPLNPTLVLLLFIGMTFCLNDQVLSSMQQKLDNLCDQLSNINNQGGTKANAPFNNNKNIELPPNNVFGCDKIKFVECGCWHCDQHHDLLAGLMGNSVVKVSRGDEVLQYKIPFINEVEHEERRMSDLSDWASSVTSAADIQVMEDSEAMNTFAMDQDIGNLKRECEEKDSTIKELTSILQSNNMAGSKRIGELEDIIRRKNTMITRLKKDMMVLEQKDKVRIQNVLGTIEYISKQAAVLFLSNTEDHYRVSDNGLISRTHGVLQVVHVTRLRRPSSLSTSDSSELPLMVNNIVYDMDSTTSPSSSDSDSSPVNRPQAPAAKIEETSIQSSEVGLTKNQKSAPAKDSSSLVGLTKLHIQSRSEKPLKEISPNQKSIGLPSSRPKQLSAGGDIRKIRRRTQSADCNQIAFQSSSYRWAAPPRLVSLSPISPVSGPTSPQLLSQFKPSLAFPSALGFPWVAPEEQLLNAEEASSAIAIGIGLSREENVGSELFSPIQRFLVLAAIGVAVAESKKNRIINQVKKSVELRDKVLSNMEQTLDNLCDQFNNFNRQEETKANDAFGYDRIEFVDSGSWHYDEHQEHDAGLMGNSVADVRREVEMEQEEQQMSDLSDWASSGSAEEIQVMDDSEAMNTFAIEQDIFNLKRKCEEKDATTKELSIDPRSIAGSKRIAELEDIVCRKNTVIRRLKEDIVVLEEKAELRLRRPSYSLSISDNWELPVMVDNILYDLDSSSSSDSDSSPANHPQPPAVKVQDYPVQSDVLTLTTAKKSAQAKGSRSTVGLQELQTKSRPENLSREISTKRKSIGLSSTRPKQLSAGEDIRKIKGKTRELQANSKSESPLKETSKNKKSAGLSSSRPKQLSAGGDSRKIRRQTQSATKDTAPKKRWI